MTDLIDILKAAVMIAPEEMTTRAMATATATGMVLGLMQVLGTQIDTEVVARTREKMIIKQCKSLSSSSCSFCGFLWVF